MSEFRCTARWSKTSDSQIIYTISSPLLGYPFVVCQRSSSPRYWSYQYWKLEQLVYLVFQTSMMAVVGERLGMPSVSWLTILFLLSSSYILLRFVYQLFFSPLNKIPGPFTARFSNIDEANALKAQRRAQWVTDLFAQNPGSVAIRTGPKSVAFNHPAAVKAIYGAYSMQLSLQMTSTQLNQLQATAKEQMNSASRARTTPSPQPANRSSPRGPKRSTP